MGGDQDKDECRESGNDKSGDAEMRRIDIQKKDEVQIPVAGGGAKWGQ